LRGGRGIETTQDKPSRHNISFPDGFSKELIFTILKDVAGTYSVDVDGLAGSFRVKEKPVPTPPVVPVVPPPPRVNWAILGPIIGVVVFLAIFLPIRLRKRRRAA